MTAEPGRLEAVLHDDLLAIAAQGGWSVHSTTALDRAIAGLDPAGARRARIDLSGLSLIDSAGALLVLRLAALLKDKGCPAELTGAQPEHMALIERVRGATGQPPPAPPPFNPLAELVARTGRAAIAVTREAAGLIHFLGLVTVVLLRSLSRPRRLRLTSFVNHVERVGLDAMPIVGLLSFLIGIVVAYQGADQLRRFGAEIFTVNLLAVSIMREMGVLLTAIVVAGRSGSAFAAQIGTMQVNQEIDAMRTIGLDPVEMLVLPRLLALVLAMPLLAVYADVMGLIGGALMSMISLDISLVQYVERLRESIQPSSFWVGVIKAPVFGFLIALIGCHEGLNVTGSAESVGSQTTRAVVVSIFLVILTDAIFSILFSMLNL